METHTHTEVVRLNGGELAERVETRCRQRGSLLREGGEGVCPLEADHDQVGSVVSNEFEGKSAANGCMRSLGGIEAPGALVETRIAGVIVPSVIVPVCAVKGVDETPCAKETPCVEATPCVSGVVASVPECVLPSTPCVKGALQVEDTTCAREAARVCEQPCGSKARCVSETRWVSERPCVRKTACVRLLCVREMSVAMREHAAASPGVSGM